MTLASNNTYFNIINRYTISERDLFFSFKLNDITNKIMIVSNKINEYLHDRDTLMNEILSVKEIRDFFTNEAIMNRSSSKIPMLLRSFRNYPGNSEFVLMKEAQSNISIKYEKLINIVSNFDLEDIKFIIKHLSNSFQPLLGRRFQNNSIIFKHLNAELSIDLATNEYFFSGFLQSYDIDGNLINNKTNYLVVCFKIK